MKPVRSALDLIRSAPARYVAHHFSLSVSRYNERLGEGAQFYTVDGVTLPTRDEVRAAMKRDGQVVSR